MITLDALNTLPVDVFTAVLGAIFEHSPWVAQRAAASRPFTSRLELLDAMRAVVQSAPVDEQLALIRAHPQLGARGRKRLELTEASAREQRRAGLDACSDEGFAQLLLLNTAYVEKFSFPFILAVRGHDPNSILAAMQSRLDNDEELERHTALTQIGLIGGYRLADVVTSPAGAEVKAMHDRLAVTYASRAGSSISSDSDSDSDSDSTLSPATGAPAGSLLREWMLAANLDVYTGARGNLAAVQRSDPSAPCLLLGLHSDPTTGDLHRDGNLGSLLGIAVAHQIRQKRLPTHCDLLILAAPTDERQGSIFLHADAGTLQNWPVMTVTETDPHSSPLPSAGITECIVLVHQAPADDSAGNRSRQPLEARMLERAAQFLEDFLTQPRQIQE